MGAGDGDAGGPAAAGPIRIMGILNVTPDSFYDGGYFFARDAALTRARVMFEESADIIDVGGESTRPGSEPVSVQEEIDRVVPVIERIRDELGCTVSVDTSKPEVMRAAVAAGAGMINDVRALRGEGALAAVAALGVDVCLMHMQGEPRTMQLAPHYADVVCEVRDFLLARVAACEAAGIPRRRIIIDPGFGFGKTARHNLELIAGLESLVDTGVPVLVGVSRKSTIGRITGRMEGDRLHGSVALAVLAACKGAALLRVHDVRPTRDAVQVVEAVQAVARAA